MERRIVEVSQLNAYIKNTLDSDFLLQNLWVCGEISNFKLHVSGHMYMSLKDSGGTLRAVMFRGAAASLRFTPESGMQVLARGRISVFPRDGAYQLYIEEMEPAGAGALYIAFEQLKNRLEAEGLFSADAKKPIPKIPRCVGVVTSDTGAAVQDIFNILRRRWPMANIILHPTRVQGEGAGAEIAEAIARFNREKEASVIIVGRGGGSQEDLWAFNTEEVARAVFASSIPIISAVGHETDFTICDFVADMRAPTPSAAAELAVPDAVEVRKHLGEAEKRLCSALSLRVSRSAEKLETAAARLGQFGRRIDDLTISLDLVVTRAVGAMQSAIEKANHALLRGAATLDALSPLKVLSRGYAVGTLHGKPLRTVKDIQCGDVLSFRLADGKVDCRAEQIEGGKEDAL